MDLEKELADAQLLMDLEKEADALKDKLADTKVLWCRSPDYLAAVANADVIAKREREKYNPILVAAEKEYNDAFARYTEMRSKPNLSQEMRDIFDSIRKGIDWGPVAFNLRWLSESGDHAIITIPGNQQWAIRGSATYAGARSYLINIKKWRIWCRGQNLSGERVLSFITIESIVGKLSKQKMDFWIGSEKDELTYAPPENSNS